MPILHLAVLKDKHQPKFMLITLTIFSEVEITIKALPLVIGNLFMNMEVYGRRVHWSWDWSQECGNILMT